MEWGEGGREGRSVVFCRGFGCEVRGRWDGSRLRKERKRERHLERSGTKRTLSEGVGGGVEAVHHYQACRSYETWPGSVSFFGSAFVGISGLGGEGWVCERASVTYRL